MITSPKIIAPDLIQPDRTDGKHTPSWSSVPGDDPYLSAEHRGICEATKELPGRPYEPDSFKLYEAAFHCGSVVLEVGAFGGRSAVVMLRGAIAGARARSEAAPQYFGVDGDPGSLQRGLGTIREAGLINSVVAYHGDLARFLTELPVTPTMVFVDGDRGYDGCRRDLILLSARLVPGTPVICHNYGGFEGVRHAVNELVQAGAYQKMGCFASSVLLRAAAPAGSRRPGSPQGLDTEVFRALREGLVERYFGGGVPLIKPGEPPVDTSKLTAAARRDLLVPDAQGDGVGMSSGAFAIRAVAPPDLAQPDRDGQGYVPNWLLSPQQGGGFVGDEHRDIYHSTKALPGWQDPPDSQKLYETAYHNGSVILEVGVYGGRSAVVELLGALAGASDKGLPPPQLYGIDVDAAAIQRGIATLTAAGIAEHAMLYHGDLTGFLSELPIVPSMVFVDGDHTYAGCWRDLRLLGGTLASGTPVVCHDYGWIPGVMRAVDEAVACGVYERMGRFASSILLRVSGLTAPGRAGAPRGLSAVCFAAIRRALAGRYTGAEHPKLRFGSMTTPARDLTAPGRAELLGLPTQAASPSPRSWPYEIGAPQSGVEEDLPRLSIITPSVNQALAMDETLMSVRHQGYENAEHIVVDRGVSGSAAAVLQKRREWVRRVIPQQKPIAAQRAAFKEATGRRLIWLEGGETLAPGELHAIGRALAREQVQQDGGRTPIEELLDAGTCHLGAGVWHPEDLAGRPRLESPRELYQTAYHHGAVILGVGSLRGCSGLVELRGAIAGARDRGLPPPQFYCIDENLEGLKCVRGSLRRAGLSHRALLYPGALAEFIREIPIVPTLVLLDGQYRYDECRALLAKLGEFLAPGTPIWARRLTRGGAVQRAVHDAIGEDNFNRIGMVSGGLLFSCCGRYRLPKAMGGVVGRSLPSDVFDTTRQALLGRMTEPGAPHKRAMVTIAARRELEGLNGARRMSGRAVWPYAAQDLSPLPGTMPGGKPWPRISIVTPSFNQGKYIEETLLSVRNQGYPNVEHIVMDGGSTDSTRELLERYREGLAHVVSKKDRGQSDAINRGFRLATGEILTWLNSDDMLAPGALAAVAMAFCQSGADMVAGECHIYSDGKFAARHLSSCEDGPLPLKDILDINGCWLEGQFFYQPEVMFTRRAWEKAGGMVRENLYHSMDYELWLRMAESGAKLKVIGRPVALFRAHPEQKTAGDVVGGFRAELPRARDEFLQRTGLAWEAPTRVPRKDSMRVVLYNDLGYAYGAGIAHKRLAEAFLAAGHEVFAVAASLTDHHGSAPKASHRDTVDRIAAFNPDLVVVGNMHGAAVDPSILGAIAARFRTAFVLHDLWLMTGRCAYTGTCRKYLDRCDAGCSCPQVHPMMDGNLVGPAWDTKRRVIGGSSNLALWANSDWMKLKADEALAGVGALAGPGPETIKFGFELDTFRPRDKATCRELLGLPEDKFIIMSSASSLADPRKGLSHLAEAMSLLRLEDAMVAAVGWFGPDEKPPIPGMRAMGYMKDPQRLAMLYSAADLFVGPSLEEAFGQVYVEAAACGTPCVGYPIGGKPEAICDGVSGRLATANEPEALAEAIRDLYVDRNLRESMGRWARLWAENEWSMSASYRRLFHVMNRQGFGEELGLGRRLNLAVKPHRVRDAVAVGPTVPGWRAVSGFDHWEGPYADRSIGRCRWAMGPAAVFELDASDDHRATVLISCRCFEHGQRVRLMHGEVAIGEREVPADTAGKVDRVLDFEVNLHAGTNRFTLNFWKWVPGGRPMALLVTGITAIPIGRKPVVEVLVGGKARARV